MTCFTWDAILRFLIYTDLCYIHTLLVSNAIYSFNLSFLIVNVIFFITVLIWVSTYVLKLISSDIS